MTKIIRQVSIRLQSRTRPLSDVTIIVIMISNCPELIIYRYQFVIFTALLAALGGHARAPLPDHMGNGVWPTRRGGDR